MNKSFLLKIPKASYKFISIFFISLTHKRKNQYWFKVKANAFGLHDYIFYNKNFNRKQAIFNAIKFSIN